MSNIRRTAHRLGAATAIALVVGALVAPPAFAHVNATAATGTDGSTIVTFTFDHGCEEAPTTSLRLELPAGAADVKVTTSPAGWTGSVTATEVNWSGPPLPSGTRHAVALSATLPGAKGDTVYFPTIQSCADAQEPWIEKTSDAGADFAAPRITLAAAGPSTTAPVATTTTAATGTPTPPIATSTTNGAPTTATTGGASIGTTAGPATPNPSSSSNLPLILGVVALIVVVGGGAAYASRRGSSQK